MRLAVLLCEAKNGPEDKRGTFGYGDVWTWAALDADGTLIVSWLVGSRDAGCAYEFMQDVASRISKRVQLTIDGHRVYLNAVEDAFGADVDYAMLTKVSGNDPTNETRYSPAKILSSPLEIRWFQAPLSQTLTRVGISDWIALTRQSRGSAAICRGHIPSGSRNMAWRHHVLLAGPAVAGTVTVLERSASRPLPKPGLDGDDLAGSSGPNQWYSMASPDHGGRSLGYAFPDAYAEMMRGRPFDLNP